MITEKAPNIMPAMRHAQAVLLVIAGLAGAPGAEPQYSAELLFPQESWHNHSSSMVELPNQDLLVCWFTAPANARPTTS